jgi:protein ImuA
MERQVAKNDIIQQLQREVRSLQGYKRASGDEKFNLGLGPIDMAFPEKTFPIGAVHELISHAPEDAAATNGFVSGLLGRLMHQGGACLWVSTNRSIFPPALKVFGVDPERIIFVDLTRQKEALWAVEEALKCEALAAVVGEISELNFVQSRRLQLAVEQSRVTGFIHRNNPKSENPVACVTRWKIKPLPSAIEDGMPGVGLPRWDVQLLKVRNGKPGSWQVEWSGGSFQHVTAELLSIPDIPTRKAG